ncbi:MAG: hypothetical protein ABSG61_10780 [Gemmatimonadales bacterium]|jgi:hypothetical protein
MDTDRLMEFLTKEGFRPSLAAGGDIRFKYESGHYCIRFAPNDDQYVAVGYPNFWALRSPAETVRALRAANEVSQWIKVAKIIVLEAQNDVWAEAELLIERPEQFEALFGRSLSILKAAVARFAESMRKSEPLPDERVTLKREEVTRWTHGN